MTVHSDSAYASANATRSELQHEYGEGVHILADPFALTQLADLCRSETTQPRINNLVRQLYRHLLVAVINHELPRTLTRVKTRMGETNPRGFFDGMLIDRSTQVVSVDIARAGILPSQVCYDLLNSVLDPSRVRQDHLIMSRVTDADDRVEGARISGDKIGGGIDGRYVLFPDPMGATGSSLATAMDYYLANHGEQPARLITLNLIITPQFIRTLRERHPDVVIYALRLDRGMSDEDVLAQVPGSLWKRETGLDAHDYIIPGGGGFGEIMNNSYV